MFKIKNVFFEITNNKDSTVNLIISNNFISYNNEKIDEMVKEVVDLYISGWLENKTNEKQKQNNIGYLANNFTIIIYSLWEWDKLISITKNKNFLINAKNFIPIISPWGKYKWKRLNSKLNKNLNKYIDNLLKLEKKQVNYKNKLSIITYYPLPILGIENGGNHRTLYLYKLLINKEINELIFNVKNEINIENILKNIVVKNNNLIFLNCKKDNLNQVISILYNCRILMKIFYSLVMNR